MIIFEMLLFYEYNKDTSVKEIYLFMYLVKLMNHKVFKTKSLREIGD